MKEALKELILSKDKKIETNITVKVNSVTQELIFDELRIEIFDNSSIYENIYIIRGEIYPTLKNNDILQVQELYLNYSDNFKIKLYVKGQIIKGNVKNDEENQIIDKNDLIEDNLFKYLKSLINNNKEYQSSIFYIKYIDNNLGFYHLLNMNDLKEYLISFNILEPIENVEYILINNYQIDNNTIIFDNLTMIKLINKEEDFFYLTFRYLNNKNMKSDIFKIIDIEKNNLILINKGKNLYKLEYKNKDIYIGKNIFIGNFNLKKIDNIFQLIIINEDSYIHISKDYLFNPQKMNLNNLSCIKFIVNDYQKENEYNIIKIFDKEKEIKEKEIYFIISTINSKYFDYFKIPIELYHSKEQKLNKKFYFILYQGFLNTIILFVNYCSPKSYFYEYLYIDIYNKIDDNIQLLSFIDKNGKTIDFNNYDNFTSENRKRLNLMNIPLDKNVEEISKKFNSIQICHFIYENKLKIFGIFNIEEIKIQQIKSNDIFDDYYDEFGNIYNELIDKKKQFDKKKIKQFIDKFTNCKLNKNDSHLVENFEDRITLSQYLTRLGYLICYYLCLDENNNSFMKNFRIHLNSIDFQLEGKNIDLYKKLRIITFYLRENLSSTETKKLYFFDELDSNNPYSLAKEFNINEINNLTEFSRLFLAYMQLDSYILFNYHINQVSYSFSMEPLYLIKYHLKCNYEEFFFTAREISDEYALQAADEKITIINEKNLFNKNHSDLELTEIKEVNESKNYALSISMEFRHEKNGHQKIERKNPGLLSPLFYFKDLKYEKIESVHNNTIKGESGRMIESFISPDKKKIKDLKTKLIYGELLNFQNLFTEKNFVDLFNKIDIINLKNKSKDDSNKTKEKSIKIEKNKSDKEIAKKEDIKETEKRNKRYEELGFYIIGDVVYPKKNKESIRYYEDYELEYKPKFQSYDNNHKDD